MKKTFMVVLLIVVIIIGGISGAYLLINKNNTDKNNIEVKYYTYDGRFVMSSYANKVDDYKKLNNNYFIKESISNAISEGEIIEVLFSGSINEDYYVYGYYTVDEFNNYFSEYIKKGLVCDGEYKYYLGEGASHKCIKHQSGYKYQKIDSELCVNIDNELVCIKPNDWQNNTNYKKMFEAAGWQCEYSNYYRDDVNQAPLDEYLECSKPKSSDRKNEYNNELFCNMSTDGGAVCNNNSGWCSINNDLNTYCFGID